MYYPYLKQSDNIVQKFSDLKLNFTETISQLIDYIKLINFDYDDDMFLQQSTNKNDED
jgi:hypothetical protein